MIRLPLPAPVYMFHCGDAEIMRLIVAGDEEKKFQVSSEQAKILTSLALTEHVAIPGVGQAVQPPRGSILICVLALRSQCVMQDV
eukprot:2306051-Rhodomonas_salina.3